MTWHMLRMIVLRVATKGFRVVHCKVVVDFLLALRSPMGGKADTLYLKEIFCLETLDHEILTRLAPSLSNHLIPKRRKNICTLRDSNRVS